MRRKLDLTKSAGRFLDKLPPKQFRQVVRTIFKLRENSTPHDSRQLVGAPEYRRVDIGEYRVIYKVEDETVKICVVGNRNDGDAYKVFERSR